MPSDFKNIIAAFIIVGLFTVSIMTFGVGIGNNYNQSADFASGGIVGLDKIEQALSQDLGNVQSEGNAWQSSFTQENINSEPGGIVMFSLWNVLKTSWEVSNGVMQLMIGGVAKALGIPAIVVGVIVTLIILTLVIAGWRVLKQGE